MMRNPAGERLAGQSYTSAELAALLNRQAPLLKANEGGVTSSGGLLRPGSGSAMYYIWLA